MPKLEESFHDLLARARMFEEYGMLPLQIPVALIVATGKEVLRRH